MFTSHKVPEVPHHLDEIISVLWRRRLGFVEIRLVKLYFF